MRVRYEVELPDVEGFQKADSVTDLLLNTKVMRIISIWRMATPIDPDNPMIANKVRKHVIVETQVVSPAGHENNNWAIRIAGLIVTYLDSVDRFGELHLAKERL